VLLLILDSLGSTELLFILVMALIFFGPRKLPQISRSLGKSIAEFRKASDDFKRTWEREVALEEPNESAIERQWLPEDNSTIGTAGQDQSPISAEHIVPRQTTAVPVDAPGLTSDRPESTDANVHSEPLRKRDWL
jgi:Tat protein translocase TatB subunit